MRLDCLCIGGANVDVSFRLDAPAVLGTSNAGSTASSFGGVARNVAVTMAMIGARTGLLAAVGADSHGWELIDDLSAVGVDAGLVRIVPGETTSRYLAVLDPDGELVIGVNAMAITSQLRPGDIDEASLDEARWVFAECNLDAGTLLAVIERRRAGGAFRLAVDATSVSKAARLSVDLSGIDLVCANADEANAILGAVERQTVEGATALARGLVARGAAAAMVSIGALGCVVDSADGSWAIGAIPVDVVDVTGAGDARIAGTLLGLLADAPLPAAAGSGSVLAAIAAGSPYTIDPRLSAQRVAAVSERFDAASVTGPIA